MKAPSEDLLHTFPPHVPGGGEAEAAQRVLASQSAAGSLVFSPLPFPKAFRAINSSA